MDRKGRKYEIEEVLPFVIFAPKISGQGADRIGQRRDYDGDMIHMASDRLKTFVTSGTCVRCGIAGKFFCEREAF